MSYRILLVALFVVALAGLALAGESVHDTDLGLSRTSVFDTPTPPAFAWPTARPGQNALLPRSYPGAPPQVPHRVGSYLPLTADDNSCVDCHDVPGKWGQKRAAGKPVPMPPSHYVVPDEEEEDDDDAASAADDDVDEASDEDEEDDVPALDGRRYVCVQCHVPQSDAPLLLGPPAKEKGRRK